MRRALITGITGQDGSFLAELLLDKGYEVHGLVRRSSAGNTWRIDGIKDRLILHDGDMMERGAVTRLLRKSEPDEIYNLAGQSYVQASFETPEYTSEVCGLAVTRLLEEIRNSRRPIRMYQASSSEMFGVSPPPQSEQTRFYPRSPYGCAKAYAHYVCVNAREAYGLHVSCGILFNHESSRRGEEFLSRKVARGVARISLGLDHELHLGNLDAIRDWGYAGDYVKAMWQMLQQDRPGDYVIATGKTHSVRELVDLAFGVTNLDWEKYVKTDSRFYRPTEVFDLRGDASLAREHFGWAPTVTFEELVHGMVETEIVRAKLEHLRS
jgi:GDPmannose 4,6-dehydratase